jgi:hypothetical protein
MRLDSTTFSIGLALSHDMRVDDHGRRTVTHKQAADVAAEIGAKMATVRAVAHALHIDIIHPKAGPELPA